MATNLGFECVVRALRIGKIMRRDTWKGDDRIYLDTKSNKIRIRSSSPRNEEEAYMDSEDLLARDWRTVEE